ncbi:MAG: hypothetical protein N2561_09555 [Bacteroidetes bacterium]|nr:hypothetical protein [Rhodothermia bacterium]MCS7156072.1 hypothetical protein [Bacteroidota bacterium]MCX7907760.1 hypothetical protein [Bacteroidota bacterium]MDW8137889.1 hypothetical protein [Bacteroidota bacterium]MDW8286260.1 hypothetical protein [Bacteroidota bacterium]
MSFITPNPVSIIRQGGALREGRKQDRLEEVARSFEALFVREVVRVLTRELFQHGGPEVRIMQDRLVDALSEPLLRQTSLGIAEAVLRRWGARARPYAAPKDSAEVHP